MRAPVPLPRTARPGIRPARAPVPLPSRPRPGTASLDFLQGKGGAFIGDAIADVGYGMTQGGFKNAFSAAGQRHAQMQPERQAQDRAMDSAQKAAELFTDNPALSKLIGGGHIDISTALAIQKAEREEKKLDLIEVNGQLVDRGTGEVFGDYRNPDDKAEDGGSSTYGGTSMDAQNWNILLRAAEDPAVLASPEYAAAYAQVTQPKVTYQQTPEGMLPVMETPQLPSWLQPPTGLAAPAPVSPGAPVATGQGIAPPTGGAAPAAATGGPTAGTVIPGTVPKQTEAQVRTELLSTSLINEVPTFVASIDAMADPKGQLLSMIGPMANPWQDERYQQAASSASASASKVLYALSGAAASDPETERIIKEITPVWGDKPAVISDKRRRFETYVRTLAEASGDPAVKKLAADVLTRTRRGAAGPAMPSGGQAPSSNAQRRTSTGVNWSL